MRRIFTRRPQRHGAVPATAAPQPPPGPVTAACGQPTRHGTPCKLTRPCPFHSPVQAPR